MSGDQLKKTKQPELILMKYLINSKDRCTDNWSKSALILCNTAWLLSSSDSSSGFCFSLSEASFWSLWHQASLTQRAILRCRHFCLKGKTNSLNSLRISGHQQLTNQRVKADFSAMVVEKESRKCSDTQVKMAREAEGKWSRESRTRRMKTSLFTK